MNNTKIKTRLLYLVESFLMNNGYQHTVQTLRSEWGLPNGHQLCDNISLELILIEFELYYYQRFKTQPQIYKNKNESITKSTIVTENTDNKKNHNKISTQFLVTNTLKYSESEYNENATCMSNQEKKINSCYEPEIKTQWTDIKGHENVKETLKEALIYPQKYPHLYTQDIVEPWKSILLYGPPGTGKTSLAKALKSECINTSFFRISYSSIISKWRGDTEKIIKEIFEEAYAKAPSIIFFDEIDAISSRRHVNEHDAARRLKSELFMCIDEMMNHTNVFLLASTNVPWDLDDAMLRRFEKHIYVPLPDYASRDAIIKSQLPEVIGTNPQIKMQLDYNILAQSTEQFSGNDVKNMCKEIKMSALREILDLLKSNDVRSNDKKMIRHSVVKEITNENIKMMMEKFKFTTFDESKYIKWINEKN